MRIEVRVIPGARNTGIQQIEKGVYKVKVRSAARGGEANKEVIRIVAACFKIKERDVEILRGLKGKNKIIHIHI